MTAFHFSSLTCAENCIVIGQMVHARCQWHRYLSCISAKNGGRNGGSSDFSDIKITLIIRRIRRIRIIDSKLRLPRCIKGILLARAVRHWVVSL